LQDFGDRDVFSHKIIGNTFTPVNKGNVDSGILDVISLDVALQAFRPLLGDESTRIVSEFKLDDGRPVVKHMKRYLSDTQEVVIPLSAQNLTEALKVSGEQVISSIEKNANCRVLQITLIFIQDTERKIWLMGSTSCTVCEKTLNRSATPGRALEKFALESSATQSSLKPKKPGVFSFKEKCSGDFCDYLLDKPSMPEEDLEDFITKISLNYSSVDTNKYKQELASTCIEKEYEKLRMNKLVNRIPFRYILIGKKLLEGRVKGQDMMILPEEVKKIDEPEYRQRDKVPNALAHPSRIYDEAKVCERCYVVYNLIRIVRVRTKEGTNLPRISRDVPSYYNIDQHLPESDEKRLSKYDKMKFGMLYNLTTTQKSGNDTLSKVEDLTSKFMPNDYFSSWSIKTQQQKNNESWQKYISSLKRKSVLRNRLKSTNP
jgi:hypothetical protein